MGVRCEKRLGQIRHHFPRGEAEDIHHIIHGDSLSTEGDHLIQHALGIAKPAVSPTSNGIGGIGIECDLLVLGYVEEMFLNQI